jgi:signal transduction histidine kinase
MPRSIPDVEAEIARLPEGPEHAHRRADLWNELGWLLRDREDWPAMLSLAQQAMDLSQAHSYQAGLVGAFRNSAFAHYMQSSYKSAFAEALVTLRMAEELDDPANQANARAVLALVQWSLGNYDEALKECLGGLRIVEQTGDAWAMAWGYTIAGGIYQTIGDHRQALEYHQKSHRVFVEQDYGLGQARTLSGLGTAHHALGDPATALDCHERALEIYRRIGNRIGEARALNDIGVICHERGESGRALALHLESLAIREAERNPQAITTSLLNLGRIYLDRRDPAKAREVAARALETAGRIGARPKAYQAHELLSHVYEQTGDLEQALEHYRRYHDLREQVFNEEASTRLKNLQIGIEVENSRRDAELHRLKNVELKEKNDQLARLLEELHATQAQLVHSEKMAALGDLVAAIAHEINTPLGVIQSSADISVRGAERVVEAVETSESLAELKARRSFQATIAALRKNGQMIAAASGRIARLVNGLKSFARLDQAEFQELDLEECLEDTLALLEPRFRETGIQVQRDYTPLPRLFGFPAELNQVFMNLLRNAGQAIGGRGAIRVRTFQEDGLLCVEVADTGHGIPAGQLSRLFNPGFTVDGVRVKASMSLFTSMNIVQKHRGEIRVASEPGKGATFTVRLRGLEPSRNGG